MFDEALAKAWIILSLRYGDGDASNPTSEQLRDALANLYEEEKLAAVDVALRDEHPSSWLRYGCDEGPEYCLEIYEGGDVVFTKIADQDDTEPLWEREMRDVAQDKALELWMLLANGEVNKLEAQDWE